MRRILRTAGGNCDLTPKRATKPLPQGSTLCLERDLALDVRTAPAVRTLLERHGFAAPWKRQRRGPGPSCAQGVGIAYRAPKTPAPIPTDRRKSQIAEQPGSGAPAPAGWAADNRRFVLHQCALPRRWHRQLSGMGCLARCLLRT